jgi:hypothetical protein
VSVLKKTSDGTKRVAQRDDDLEDAARAFEEERRAARTLKKLFEDAGLDIRQPEHWDRLRETTLANSHHFQSRVRGKLWDRDSLLILGFLWDIATRGRPPMKLTEAATLIRKLCKERGGAFSNWMDGMKIASDRSISRRLPKAIETLWRRLDFWRRHPRLTERVDKILGIK